MLIPNKLPFDRKRIWIQSRSLISILKVLSVSIAIVCLLGLACSAPSEEIVIVHSNDTHGIIKPYKIDEKDTKRLVGGMEATSHYLNEIRTREKNVLVIEKGDIMTGTLAAEVEYKGVIGGAVMEFMNLLDYDVWCYGNHDFDKGQDNAIGLSELAEFPTIMANIVYEKDNTLFPADPFRIFNIGSLRVGVIAVMEENFLTEVQKDKVEGLAVLPMVSTLNSYIPALDEQTDLIVVLSHGWFKYAVSIAQNVKGIDIVLAASEDGRFEVINDVLVQSTIGHQKTLGYMKFSVKNDRVVSFKNELIWLWADIDLKPSSQFSSLVHEVEGSIGKEYSKVIGKAPMNQTALLYSKVNSAHESALGNWITDVMRWKTGAQIAFHNSGAIRANISAGPITKADVFKVSPFQNTLVVFKLTGQQIKDLLEFDVNRGWDKLQVSGLQYKYFPRKSRPFGKRVVYIEVNGEILQKDGKVIHPDKVYTVVSNNYLVGQTEDKYFGFSVNKVKDTGFPLDISMMEWLEKHKILDYKNEERIVEIKSSH